MGQFEEIRVICAIEKVRVGKVGRDFLPSFGVQKEPIILHTDLHSHSQTWESNCIRMLSPISKNTLSEMKKQLKECSLWSS